MNTLEQIKDALKAHIAEAEAATPGDWVANGYDVHQPGQRMVAYCGPHHTPEHEYPKSCKFQDEDNATFIAHARTMSPAACKCLLAAIDMLGDMPFHLADVMEQRIRQEWHNLTQKQ